MKAWAAALVLVGCASGPGTQERLERALAPAFTNLIHLEEPRLGLPPVDAATLKATASCQRVAGHSWKCSLSWHTAQGAPLRDSYDVAVTPDGCYTATVEGTHMGGPTLTAADGRKVLNLLYVFDGCFDTT